jgi:hypothetical protein
LSIFLIRGFSTNGGVGGDAHNGGLTFLGVSSLFGGNLSLKLSNTAAAPTGF